MLIDRLARCFIANRSFLPKSIKYRSRKVQETKEARRSSSSSSMDRDIQFRPAHSVSAQRIADFVADRFISGEPITVSLNTTKEKLYDMFRVGAEKCLKQDASFVCLDARDQVIACCLCDIQDMESASTNSDADKTFSVDSTQWSDDAKKIIKFLEALTVDLKKHVPDCKLAMELLFLATDPRYKGRGLAGRLSEMSIAQGRKLGCQYCYTEATAYASQHVFEKMGFKTVKIIEHKDYVDENGKQIFTCKDNTTCGKLMIYKL